MPAGPVGPRACRRVSEHAGPHPAPSGGSLLWAGQHAKPFTWIISFNPRRCLHDGQSYYFPRFLGLRFWEPK